MDYETILKISSPYKIKPKNIPYGISYNDDGSINLCLYAAGKQTHAKAVYLLGKFNNFNPITNDLMYRDDNVFWITTDKLHVEDAFQYMVIREDDVIKYISDPYSRKIERVYDRGKFQTILTEQDIVYKDEFIRPDKNNLIIYEMWVGWFSKNKRLDGVIERLDYLKDLGVNAIELLPLTDSFFHPTWGYDPGHYFIINSDYGDKEDLINLVKEAHKHGIAVIMDMVFNHATSHNPMNRLYPRENNPWMTIDCPHKPDDFFEDWDFGFQPLRDMVKSAMQFWIDTCGIDGYRLDLAHGLCDGNGKGAVEFLIECYDEIIKPRNCYLTAEYFGGSKIEDAVFLGEHGILCWKDCTKQYQQIAMGWEDNSNIQDLNLKNSVGCAENHDNEHMFFKAKKWGNNIANIYDRTVIFAFQMLLQGAQLFYNFTELGWSSSIYQDENNLWGIESIEKYGIQNDLPYEAKMTYKKTPEILNCNPIVKKIINFRKDNPQIFNENGILTENNYLKTIEYPSLYAAMNFSTSENINIDLPKGEMFLGERTNIIKPGEIIIVLK